MAFPEARSLITAFRIAGIYKRFYLGVPADRSGRALRSYAHKALGAGPVSATIPNAGWRVRRAGFTVFVLHHRFTPSVDSVATSP